MMPFAFLALLAFNAQGRGTEADLALLNHARAQLLTWKTQARQTSQSQVSTISTVRNGVLESKTRSLFRRSGANFVLANEVSFCSPGKKVPEFCFGRNSRYFFELGKGTGGWVWRSGASPVPDYEACIDLISPPILQLQLRPNSRALSANATIQRFNHDVADIVDLPDFRVVSLVREADAFTVSYSFKAQDSLRGDRQWDAVGVLKADARRSYATVFCTLSFRRPHAEREQESKFSYSSLDDRPFAVRTEHRRREVVDGQEVLAEVVTIETDVEWRDMPAESFTAAAFGLPEPFGVSWPRPTPWFLYAGITAGAILVICVLLAWWQKRLQARA